MSHLLDTHTLIWRMEDDPALNPVAARVIADPRNDLFVSMASVWEMAIKSGLGKIGFTVPFPIFLRTAVSGYQLTVLPITPDDCVDYEQLPFPDKNHRDPFDRMIVTHALRHGMTVVSIDQALDAYGMIRLW